jgi:hypothetical protein
MAYLDATERAELLRDLQTMSFNRAKGKLRMMDRKGKLAVYRNAQMSGKFYTRFDLEGLGTRVTLIEREIETPQAQAERNTSKFELVEIIVEPTPENRT